MTPVPLIHITEILASAFGIYASKLAPRPSACGELACRCDVTDDRGGRWLLEVSSSPPAVALPTEGPSASRARSTVRWGRHWWVVPLDVAPMPGQGMPAPMPRPRVAWSCADGRALERVGSWLAQPAGLPTATDILGQCFVDTLHRHRDLLAVMHAQAEALHDGLAWHPVAAADNPGDVAWRESLEPETYRHQHVLRRLVQTQERLLGPQSARFSTVQRWAALRELARLLDAERESQRTRQAVYRVG
ncbi:hypothetical protein [Xanthomonas sp. 60]